MWIENIPFAETRDYVKKVLSNATYYAALLGGNGTDRALQTGAPRPARSGRADPNAPAPETRPALTAPRKILVLGGTGFVGRSPVCEKLVERSGGADGRIRVATRRIMRARHFQLLPTTEIAVGPTSTTTLRSREHAARDRCGGQPRRHPARQRGRSSSASTFDLPERLAAACIQAGVRRVVHVSALGAAADAPSRYLRSKARGEAALRCSPGST